MKDDIDLYGLPDYYGNLYSLYEGWQEWICLDNQPEMVTSIVLYEGWRSLRFHYFF